jgi:RNA polymerase sigma factor (sigma-70 family)
MAKVDAAPVRNMQSFLFRAAHNLAVDWHRRKATRERTKEEIAREAEAQPPENSPEGLAAFIRRAACERAVEELAKLPDRQRHVLLLKVIQDMTLREIGQVTGLTVGNVAYHLNAGLSDLARRLRSAGMM